MVTIPEFNRTVKSFFLKEDFMQFIGVDLHTNKFTCCYRGEGSPAKGKGEKEKVTETFELTSYGLAQFCKTLTPETYVLVEATITTFCFTRLIQPLVKEVLVANTIRVNLSGAKKA
jgi:hypothetical protein